MHSEDSDHTERMPRLIWVFAGRTCHFVDFVVHWLKYCCQVCFIATESRNKFLGLKDLAFVELYIVLPVSPLIKYFFSTAMKNCSCCIFYVNKYPRHIETARKMFVYVHSDTITKTRLFKYIENFTTKNWKFSDKNFDIFYISAQNIDCEY